MFDALERGCRNDEDRAIVLLIKRIHGRLSIKISEKHLELKNGVAQVIVMTHLLFNIALDQALKTSALLSGIARQ
jgi:hypothetical protein